MTKETSMTKRSQETVLITGASSGIGAAFARLMAERGAHCIITARREDRLLELKQELESKHGVEVTTIAHDLGTHGGADALYEKVKALGKEVTVLINNAGFGIHGKSVTLELDRVKQMVELNMTALTILTQRFAKDMVQRGYGRILQVASIGAYQPSPYYAVYSATKSYVLSFSQAMDYELRGTGVNITVLSPGLTATEFHAVADHIKPKSLDAISMSAEAVARIGINSLYRRRPVVTSGLVNKIMALFIKLIPRSWATAIAAKTMQK